MCIGKIFHLTYSVSGEIQAYFMCMLNFLSKSYVLEIHKMS